MSRFVEGEDRRQAALLPSCLDDYVSDDNPARVVDVFVDELDLQALGFDGMAPAATGRPAYHPRTLLKLYIYGYLNRVQSSRRLEREAQRNIELMWLRSSLLRGLLAGQERPSLEGHYCWRASARDSGPHGMGVAAGSVGTAPGLATVGDLGDRTASALCRRSNCN